VAVSDNEKTLRSGPGEARALLRYGSRVPQSLDARGLAVTVAVAGAAFLVAFRGGSYGVAQWSALSVLSWWLIALLAASGTFRLRAVPAAARFAVGSLLGLATWSIVSIAWTDDPGAAYEAAARVILYAGVVLLVATLGVRLDLRRWCNGLAIAGVAVALVAFLSRVSPGTFHGSALVATFLPRAQSRLSYPLNYWNALGVFVALAVPLLLRVAVESRSSLLRGAAVVPLPLIAVVLFLASSRGAMAVAVMAVVGFVAFAKERWRAVSAIAFGVAASTLVVHLVQRHPLLTAGPFTSPAAVSEVRRLMVELVVFGLLGGVAHAAVSRLLTRVQVPRWVSATAVVVAALVTVAFIVQVHPIRRLHQFQTPASQLTGDASVSGHLASFTGSGRWQLWTEAVNEFRAHPVLGGGAGSYEAWWLQRSTLVAYVRDAHSIYLETLAELGILGLLALTAPFFAALFVAARGLRRGSDDRTPIAALTAALIAFAVAAGIDWIWKVPGVALAGCVLLGLLCGRATNAPVANAWQPARRSPRAFAVALAVTASALALAVAAAIPALTDLRLAASRQDVGRGDLATAYRNAQAAHTMERWSYVPMLQLALIDEQHGRLDGARNWLDRAAQNAPNAWTVWFIRARVETKLGNVKAAVAALERARTLNPQSPLFG
jgi:hypothetical protein